MDLAGGVPFISDTQLREALDHAGVDQETADAVMSVNSGSPLEALRTALALTALLAIAKLLITGRLPEEAVGAQGESPRVPKHRRACAAPRDAGAALSGSSATGLRRH